MMNFKKLNLYDFYSDFQLLFHLALLSASFLKNCEKMSRKLS